MAGGLIQLLAWGSQNIKLNGNPSLTFFKKVLKSHTNFSMESIRVNLNRTDANVYASTILKGKIKRHGDLVQQIYFVFEVPDIKPNAYEFKWIENLGEAIIDNYYVNIGGVIADKQYGEYIHINNMLTLGEDKRKIYDRMIGNISELANPKVFTGIYPSSNPAVKSRKIYVPLNFWFNKDSGCALPLLCLQYSDTEITIELRPILHLYKLLIENSFIAPRKYNENELLHNFVSNDFTTYMSGTSVLDIKAYLEVNYYFLDKKEREILAFNPHEYLIEQVFRIDRYKLSETNIYELILQNPVKEFIWVLKRSDLEITNDWFNFTDRNTSILKSGKFMFNGMDRIDEKDWLYFNYLQPYQHHSSNPKDGIYVYSFSISPDDNTQPSGSCNMSRINKIQIMLNLIKPLSGFYNYDLTIYVISYNFLKITSGIAGVVFSN
jgi:hypothetical protein